MTNLNSSELDEDEIQANIVLNRKNIEADSVKIADMVFTSSTDQVTE